MWFRPVRPIFSKNPYFTEAAERVGQLLGCFWHIILIFRLKIDELDSTSASINPSKGFQREPRFPVLAVSSRLPNPREANGVPVQPRSKRGNFGGTPAFGNELPRKPISVTASEYASNGNRPREVPIIAPLQPQRLRRSMVVPVGIFIDRRPLFSVAVSSNANAAFQNSGPQA